MSRIEQTIEAMKVELTRSIRELRIENQPPPYFISYLLRYTQSVHLWARYGSLYQDDKMQRASCYADVRVGSYSYDQVEKAGLSGHEEEAGDQNEMPIEAGEDALRFALWRLTDARYREALSKFYARKSKDIHYVNNQKALPSWTRSKGQSSLMPIKKELNLDVKKWRSFVKRASLIFKNWQFIKNSYVELNVQLQTKVFMSSEGVLRVWQEPIYSLTTYMWWHSSQLNQDLTHCYHFKCEADLPSFKTFRADIVKKLKALEKMHFAEALSAYSGPVLLSPKVAGLFLHEVVGHRLEGNRLLSDSDGRTFADKLNKSIMHKDLSIIDDPSLESFQGKTLLGSYAFDDEGSPAKRVELVRRGVLKNFLSSKSPLKARAHRSNAHARNQSCERPTSRMANFIVLSHSSLDFDELKKTLIEEVKRRDLEFGLILIDAEGGETSTETYDFQAFLGELTIIKKIYQDGTEVYAKGVDFVGTPLSSLSNILAVGSQLEVDNAYCGAESGCIPVATVSPALLLSSLELQLKDPSKLTEYALALPWVK